MEEIVRRIQRFRLLDEETRRRVLAKVQESLPYLNEERRRKSVDIYAFTEGRARIVASTNGKLLLVHPPVAKRPFITGIRWAVIGDLGILGETSDGEPFLFPSYTKGPGKVLAVVWRGRIFHRGEAYVRRSK